MPVKMLIVWLQNWSLAKNMYAKKKERPQLCDLCSDTCCLFMADTINITAPLLPPKYIILNASVLFCLLGAYLPTSWTGSLSSQTINNCRLTGMIFCHLQKVYLPAPLRWLNSHPAKYFCLTTTTFHALTYVLCWNLRMDGALEQVSHTVNDWHVTEGCLQLAAVLVLLPLDLQTDLALFLPT